MAEVTTTAVEVDLLNIERLVSDSDISRLTKNRNCLVHAMHFDDIVRVVWKLVSRMPMMQMHRMYATAEIFKLPSSHMLEIGKDALEPLKDGKQKMVLCPIRLPLSRKYPGKDYGFSLLDRRMEPVSTTEMLTDKGLQEQHILVDRDGCFHSLDVFWETMEEFESRSCYEYHGHRQLKSVSLRQLSDVDDLYNSAGRVDKVRFFLLSTNFLEEALRATLDSARHNFESSVGIDGMGEEEAREKYLTIVRAMNLFKQVCRQVHHRYGC